MKAEREKEEEGDVMKALENKTLDNKVEMDILDALDEQRLLNARHDKIDVDAAITALQAPVLAESERIQMEEDAIVASIKFGAAPVDKKRVHEESGEEDSEGGEPAQKRPKTSLFSELLVAAPGSGPVAPPVAATAGPVVQPVLLKKKVKKPAAKADSGPRQQQQQPAPTSVLSLGLDYGDDDQ
eukprot:TRINITY_DN4272_c0_g1_i1.p2 TRINITY_DN4272_c0_g1~~TRINITY_DN4272_c0_g1_i1.p2  ORF type:complete len:184 (-),score=69.37 TRINITY_DN4272_c0_g1_i1:16-567(-)